VAVIQRMASVQILPLGNYPNGPQNFGPIEVASDVTSILFSIQRCTSLTPTIWPNASTTLDVIPEVSLDGGLTWFEAGRTTNVGGIQQARQGGELGFSQSGGFLPAQVGATPRQYKVSTNVGGGPIRTAITVEVN
jgi:hypothetical protein